MSPDVTISAPLLELITKARQQGKVRIIVGLRGNYRNDAALSAQEAQAQRSEIAQTQTSLVASFAAFGTVTVAEYRYIPYIAFAVDFRALEYLVSSPLVASIEEDTLMAPTVDENLAAIGAPAAWNTSMGAGQKIAILDTGINHFHPAFDGRVFTEACFSDPTATTGAELLCPNGQATQYGIGTSFVGECIPNIIGSFLPKDCEHGNHVAGIAAEVAPGAEIISVQVYVKISDLSICDGYTSCVRSYPSDQLRALEYIYSLRGDQVAAVNLSLGSDEVYSNAAPCDATTYAIDGQDRSYKGAIDLLREAGIATIIASGNHKSDHPERVGGVSFPACISSAVAVGATDNADHIASFTNGSRSPLLDLFAPGVDIVSAVPLDSFGTRSGTSQAAPHVAGAWAILKAAMPSATVDQIFNAFRFTGVPITDDSDPNNVVITPRIQIDAALSWLLSSLPTPTPSPTMTVPPGGHLITNLNDDGPGSLRQTIADASGGDTIQFGVTGTIQLASRILVDKNLTIVGPGGAGITLSGGAFTTFFVNSGVTVVVDQLTVANSDSYDAVTNLGSLIIRNSTFANNDAGGDASRGGAIYNYTGATLKVINSTFSGNSAVYGKDIASYGTLEISFSTLSSSGSLYISNGSATVKNSIVSHCTVAAGTLTAVGANLAADTSCQAYGFTVTNPLLDVLGDYGGPTQTQRIAGQPYASLALDATSDCTDLDGNTLTTDQRGQPRSGLCDLGAFEYQMGDAPITRTVTNLNDSEAGSLRQAVLDAHHGDTIEFGVTGTIQLASRILVDKNLTLVGPGGAGITLSGGAFTTFFVNSGVTVVVDQLTVANSDSYDAVTNLGNLIIRNSTFANNDAGGDASRGGAIYNYTGATLKVINSTFSGNSAVYGKDISSFGTLEISFSTLSSSGSLYISNGSATVKNSIVSHCTVGGGTLTAVGANLAADTSCQAYGFTVTNPLLDVLGDYGGPTQTQRIAGQPYASLALDATSDCTDLDGNTLTTDQRGQPRSGLCDLGAFEYQMGDAPITRTVTNLNDSEAGSLRQTVLDAHHGDTIEFGVTGTIQLASRILVDKNLTLVGPGGAGITLSGGAFTTFFVNSGVTVVVDQLTVANSDSYDAVTNLGNLIIRNSTFANNDAGGDASRGGAIYNYTGATLKVINSTFSGNSAVYGSDIYSIGTLEVSNSTLTSGGTLASSKGLYVVGSGTIKNSIVNHCTVSGSLTAVGANLAADTSCQAYGFTINNVNPLLDELGNYGGPTQTMRLQFGSPAIDAGDNSLAVDHDGNPLLYDQRGPDYPRIVGERVDLGAYESAYTPPGITTQPQDQTILVGRRQRFP